MESWVAPSTKFMILVDPLGEGDFDSLNFHLPKYIRNSLK